MRISDWSSDVCSSDLGLEPVMEGDMDRPVGVQQHRWRGPPDAGHGQGRHAARAERACIAEGASSRGLFPIDNHDSLTSTLKVPGDGQPDDSRRTQEQTSELQSIMRHTYTVFCLK